LSKYAS